MIYLDHNATSPLLPEVRAMMLPWLERPTNPSSAHAAGQAAMGALERAREQVAALVGARPSGVVFTSGATEANHLFLRGAFEVRSGRLVVGSLEHPCVLGAAGVLQRRGVPVTFLPADRDGVVDVRDLPPDTAVVSLMAANHETGVCQPVEAAWEAAQAQGAWLHVDASQAAGRVDLTGIRARAVVLSSHKLGGPLGIGALVLPDGEPFPPLFPGAQERGRRGGTVNVPGAVGFGMACVVASEQRQARMARWVAARERLEAGLRALGGRVVGDRVPRVANTTCVVFAGLTGEALVQALDLRGVCVSAGAACQSGSLEPSPTLSAMGDPEPSGALRISQGPATTQAELDAFLAVLPSVLDGLRLADGWMG
ncbi:MAG: cysteine desulfurase [Alphaproteobacteria bacterium]|nr:cysteine desulfurase [Alphaproteobacteria bacterium]